MVGFFSGPVNELAYKLAHADSHDSRSTAPPTASAHYRRQCRLPAFARSTLAYRSTPGSERHLGTVHRGEFRRLEGPLPIQEHPRQSPTQDSNPYPPRLAV